MFAKLFKRRKIKQLVKRLPESLKFSYGYQQHYSPEQVRQQLEQKRLTRQQQFHPIYYAYGYVMFCSQRDFEQTAQQLQQQNINTANWDYQAMRSEVSHTLFGAEQEFNMSTLLMESSGNKLVASSSDSGYGDDGGGSGFDSGGGGGADGGSC